MVHSEGPEAEPRISLKHPAVRLARALQTPKGRALQAHYLLEGANMVAMAFSEQASVREAFIREDSREGLAELLAALRAAAVPAYSVSSGVLFKIAGTPYQTAITAIATVRQRLWSEEELLESLAEGSEQTLLVAAENLQDPRNLGVLIRTADAVGASGLIASRPSPTEVAAGPEPADPYSRAAVRSSTGSILRLPICLCHWVPGLLGECKKRGLTIVATSAQGECLLWQADLTGPAVICFGNETHGLSEEIRSVADQNLRIPMLGGAHSLNVAVAAGIILYERLRQLRHNPQPSA